MTKKEILQQIFKSIIKDDLEAVIEKIEKNKNVLELDDAEENLFVQLQARFNANRKQRLSGTIEKEKLRIEENDVRLSFLLFTNSINSKDEVEDDIKDIEEKLSEKDKEVKRLSKEISKVGITRNIFLGFILLALLSLFLLAKNGFTPKVFEKLTEEINLRDLENKDFKEIRMKSQIFTVDNLLFDSSTCPIFDSLKQKFDAVKPLDFSFLRKIEKYFDINQPSFKRFKTAFENEEDANFLCGTKIRQDVFCNELFWILKDKIKGENANLLVFPDKPQVSVVILTIKGEEIKNAILEVNNQEHSLATLVQKHSDYSEIEINTNKDEIQVCMMIGENLKFETQKGNFEISITRISNPGDWREPFNRSEDIATALIKFNEK